MARALRVFDVGAVPSNSRPVVSTTLPHRPGSHGYTARALQSSVIYTLLITSALSDSDKGDGKWNIPFLYFLGEATCCLLLASGAAASCATPFRRRGALRRKLMPGALPGTVVALSCLYSLFL